MARSPVSEAERLELALPDQEVLNQMHMVVVLQEFVVMFARQWAHLLIDDVLVRITPIKVSHLIVFVEFDSSLDAEPFDHSRIRNASLQHVQLYKEILLGAS